ncbi:XRE family transcriptional regulator [Sphingobium terrigena]|uniref:XRE family transcriptional regulator n=1 Tax=Sphingobium terrigena TaxID=2304063 RepID=A0A418YTK0_9SPHN|nr:helix-turn-helix transcriptional regulator [Sphingobium terrigena]RJG55384.1 XRE family transcriptional regulator [Sphingobium terrigena]
MSDEIDVGRKGEALGIYLKSLRSGTGLTLREVEDATGKDVSNAYLSQLENGHIAKPSPNVLHSLASVYKVPYAKLMERAGYISPNARSSNAAKHGRAATFSIENLTLDEEKELLQYLSFVRQKAKS